MIQGPRVAALLQIGQIRVTLRIRNFRLGLHWRVARGPGGVARLPFLEQLAVGFGYLLLDLGLVIVDGRTVLVSAIMRSLILCCAENLLQQCLFGVLRRRFLFLLVDEKRVHYIVVVLQLSTRRCRRDCMCVLCYGGLRYNWRYLLRSA